MDDDVTHALTVTGTCEQTTQKDVNLATVSHWVLLETMGVTKRRENVAARDTWLVDNVMSVCLDIGA
jgi:hypothetical protein